MDNKIKELKVKLNKDLPKSVKDSIEDKIQLLEGNKTVLK